MIISSLSRFWHSGKIIWIFHSHEYDIPLKSKVSYLFFSHLPWVKKILFVNKELKQFFTKRFQFPKGKTDIVYNSSNFQQINKESDTEIKWINIGFVGRLIELKRVHYLVELAAYLKNQNIHHYHIHVIGDGPERNDIEKKARDLQVVDKITFYGFQAQTEQYYELFHLFINPSREECLSIALIDAGMKGVPAIAFDVGGNDEIIKHNKTGFIVNQKQQLFEYAEKLIRYPQLLNDMGYQAGLHCTEYFSKEAHWQKLTQIIDEIAQ